MKILFLLFVLTFTPVLAHPEEPLCDIAKQSFQDAIRIRHLSKLREVPCTTQNQDQVKKFILDTIQTKYVPQKIEMEEKAYKALGFLPEDFDYKKGLIDFYASQVGGYYDPDKKRFVMAAWMPGLLQTTVAVHELTHALQDQHFNLKDFTDERKYSSDELMARSALIEGDATSVMMDNLRAMAGQKGLETEPNVDSLMMQNIIGFSLVSSAANVPKGLQMLLFFPYTSGLRFVHAALKRGGYREVDRIFERPPGSTEEILHPEKYFAGTHDFTRIDPESILEDPASEHVRYPDVAGEFFISALLIGLGEAPAAAATASAGWAGDVVVVSERSNGETRVYWVTQWDSERDLREFSESYGRALKKQKKAGKYSFETDEKTLRATLIAGK